ncbi:hypothetical protein [Falsiroseomonas selenitidurans]|uniref:Uncharacterized protein n=1 Tax=Falsiroseomonas selenitidurans TaxID=2716335 RepID=A0ABX1E533_9PROT|nr:hypothetical protein [Falsiroseomonas selenitidurans]NKC31830.1 hypothetical protein [Falsiroseomonas selenitidurans]
MRRPHPALRGLAGGLRHDDEARAAPQHRRKMPCAEAVQPINRGPLIGVARPDPAAGTRW